MSDAYFIEELEALVDELADWGFKLIKDTIESLSPGGRPFGMKPRTKQEQLQVYLPLRNDEQAATLYIEEKTQTLIQTLIQEGVPEDAILSMHPYDRICNHVLKWSAEMEGYIEKEGLGDAESGFENATEPAGTESLEPMASGT